MTAKVYCPKCRDEVEVADETGAASGYLDHLVGEHDWYA